MHIPRTLGLLSVTVLLSHAQEVAPGIVNYSEGQVNLHAQMIETGQGRAEVLLTPGVYLRIDECSVIEMENGGVGDVKLELVRGQALLEVDQVDENFRLHLIAKGVDMHVDHSGLYLISAGEPARG